MSLAAEFAREALKPLPDEDHILRGFTAMLLATVLRWEGRLGEASEAYEQAITINQQAGDKNVLLETYCDLAGLQALQGKLHDSLDTCQEALSLARSHFEQMGTRLPAHGYACIRMSDILRERNELEQAREWAREGLELSQDWGQADLLVRVYIYSARALKACGDASEAAEALRSAHRVASELSPWYIGRVEAWEADLDVECGDMGEAWRWAETQAVGEELAFHDFESNLTLARIHILTQQTLARVHKTIGSDLEIEEFLDRLANMALETGAHRYLLDVQILQALHKQAANLHDQAREIISNAFRIAAPEEFLRPFLRYGETIRPLLIGAQAGEGDDDFHRGIREALLEWGPIDAPQPTGLSEPLSNRELEVLRMLPTHLSTTEIADELCVAPSTIRSHIKSIYNKLDVHSRTEAVDRAVELELL
jgi:LuxR family maltose regulon positive regulatory protein